MRETTSHKRGSVNAIHHTDAVVAETTVDVAGETTADPVLTGWIGDLRIDATFEIELPGRTIAT
jgi:hypothetical protein